MLSVDELLARPGLPKDLRLLLTATAAIEPADWSEFGACLEAAKLHGPSRGDFEEMGLQAVLFYGFPRCITAFELLAEIWPALAESATGRLPALEQAQRGREIFAMIYRHNDEPVRQKLRSLHPELHDYVLECAYGRVLSRPGLALLTRELIAVCALAKLEQIPQLVAHARGALHLGAGEATLTEALWTAWRDDQRVAATMRRVQRNGR